MKVTRISDVSYEDLDYDIGLPRTVSERFREGADIKEGVSGKTMIDTTYEQQEATQGTVEERYYDYRGGK